jgi:hypothetical protein
MPLDRMVPCHRCPSPAEGLQFPAGVTIYCSERDNRSTCSTCWGIKNNGMTCGEAVTGSNRAGRFSRGKVLSGGNYHPTYTEREPAKPHLSDSLLPGGSGHSAGAAFRASAACCFSADWMSSLRCSQLCAPRAPDQRTVHADRGGRHQRGVAACAVPPMKQLNLCAHHSVAGAKQQKLH